MEPPTPETPTHNPLQLADRRRQVIAMMLAGARPSEIARALGVRVELITLDVKVIRKEWREEQGADYHEWVAAEVARLDQLQTAHWRAAMQGGYRATDICIRIIERRAKLLGLDAPERHVVVVPDGTTLQDISAKLASLAAALPSAEDEDGEVIEGETAG